MAKIAFFELESWEVKEVKAALKGHDVRFFEGPLTSRRIKDIKDVEVLGIFVFSPVTKEIITKLPKLKMIATMSTGYDHIDLVTCKERKIIVTNVPFYGENTVAEHAMALLLALAKKIPESVARTRAGDFGLKGLRGFDLKGKTLGIVGVGHIGSHVARMAKGFEMKLLGYCRAKDPKLVKETGLRYVPLNTLLRKSDIISLHLPLNEQTQHIINKSAFQKMKKGVILINTARGPLIDTNALLQALSNGTVAAAGLDVLEGECHIKEERQLLSPQFKQVCDIQTVLADHLLAHRGDVIITPHNAFNSTEALLRIMHTTLDNIKGYLKKKPKNVVCR